MRYFIAGLFVGLMLNHLFGARIEGDQPLVGINLKIHKRANQCLHIHHWMYLLPIIILIVLTIKLSGGKITPPISIVIGVLSGLVIYDFRYEDWYQITVACQQH